MSGNELPRQGSRGPWSDWSGDVSGTSESVSAAEGVCCGSACSGWAVFVGDGWAASVVLSGASVAAASAVSVG